MSRSSQPYIRAALFLLMAGCTKGDAPRADSTGARAVAAGAPPATRPITSGRSLPGALTKPIDSYTGDEFYALVEGLQYTADSVKDRKCKNSPTCVSAPKTRRVRVGVAAVVGQDSLSAGTTPKFGVVYIRATNKGDVEEARYNMKPGKNLEYYVVVLPDSAGTMKWRLEQLDTSAGARQHVSVGTGPFTPCTGHTWVPGARADFKTCAGAATAKDSIPKSARSLVASDQDPMWVSCATGCCSVGST